MEELVKRARLILNFIFTSCLILIWSAHDEPVDIKNNIITLNRLSKRLLFENPSAYQNTLKFVEDVSQNSIDNISISSILKIKEDSISRLKYFNLNRKRFDSIYKTLKGQLNRKLYSSLNSVEYDLTEHTHITIIAPLLEQLNIIETLFIESGLNKNVKISQINKKIKTTIEIPILKKSISTDNAILLISIFIMFPLLLLISNVKTISRIRNQNNEGISWVFFHNGKLGLSLGIIQIFLPFLTALYIILKGRMELIYTIPVTTILFALGILCAREILKARKNFYANLKS